MVGKNYNVIIDIIYRSFVEAGVFPASEENYNHLLNYSSLQVNDKGYLIVMLDGDSIAVSLVSTQPVSLLTTGFAVGKVVYMTSDRLQRLVPMLRKYNMLIKPYFIPKHS